MILTIFVIWFIWERLAERIFSGSPLLPLILIVSDLVALILVIIIAFGLGPIRIGI
jgi:hypothetical protein